MISDPRVVECVSRLDPVSRGIVEMLISRRHASLEQIGGAACVGSDMEAIGRIEAVNRVARATIGRPILVFRDYDVDPLTGDGVAYHWWIDGRVCCTEVVAVARETQREVLVSLVLNPDTCLTGDAELVITGRAVVIRLLKGNSSRGDTR